MATLDKTVKFKAGGKEYTVCYPLKAVMGAEQELPENSLFKAVATASLTNFYIMLKWGLIGGGMPENTPAETFDEIWGDATDGGILGTFESDDIKSTGSDFAHRRSEVL